VSTWAFAVAAVAAGTIGVARRLRDPFPAILLPLASAAIFVCAWQVSCDLTAYAVRNPDGTFHRLDLFPAPWQTWIGLRRLVVDGMLLRNAVASIYRVACGFGLAVLIGIPLGLWTGWSLRAAQALNPLIQGLRPISPIAWIPLAVVWFGIRDNSAVFLVFLASIFPIVTGTMTAVRAIPVAYVRSARNFGLEGPELFRRVVFPACLPQIVTSLRIALGIAWMVIVAAEMIAVESGLGYEINDARNASNYDLVVATMVAIGVLGVCLDLLMRRLERFDEVRWGFSKEA